MATRNPTSNSATTTNTPVSGKLLPPPELGDVAYGRRDCRGRAPPETGGGFAGSV